MQTQVTQSFDKQVEDGAYPFAPQGTAAEGRAQSSIGKAVTL